MPFRCCHPKPYSDSPHIDTLDNGHKIRKSPQTQQIDNSPTQTFLPSYPLSL